LRANETKIWGFQSRIESGKLQEEKKIEEPIEFFIRNLKINRMAYFSDEGEFQGEKKSYKK
jgi:hypothetical protein